MARTGTANPILIVDEIDKTNPAGHNGDMRATLLTLLEPQSSARWPDEYLLSPCNLSQVSWILTANELTGLPEPLLSRVRVIRVRGPEPEHFEALLHGILRDLADELLLTPELLPELEPSAVDLLYERFRRDGNVRRLRAAMTTALSCSAVTIEARTRH